jgi:hypothetical protein
LANFFKKERYATKVASLPGYKKRKGQTVADLPPY